MVDMKSFVCVLAGALLSTAALGAETGTVVESFGCNLKPGKTLVDWRAVNDAFTAAASDIAALDHSMSGYLVPLRVTTPYDVAWVSSEQNLNGWARSIAAWLASAAGQSVDAQFAEVADCDSALWLSTPLHQGLADDPADNDDVIEFYACRLREGKTATDIEAVNRSWQAAVAALKARVPSFGGFSTSAWTPLYATTTGDVFYWVVNDDLETFARDNSTWLTSAEGQAADAMTYSVLDCDAELWAGTRILRPKAQR
jgi:hypothetical protein